MNKRRLFLSVAALMVIFTLSLAQPGSVKAQRHSDLGVGFILGEPTGLSLKGWTGSTTAFDVGMAWSFANDSNLYLHSDYLWHNYGVFNVDQGELPIYYGIGGRILFDDETQVGARIPVGASYMVENAPIEVFFELAPIFDIVPETEFDMSGGIGARIYF